ncbi:MAG: hypothetical protein BEN19_07025 [Epulopiscium sp. Nuni2H_MBin003]|nr:MAG: hypothetical protein BEN19_07025 [Epulopiscium sp. Nuni2H_MBin003]
MKNWYAKLKYILQSRIFILFSAITVAFAIVLLRFYQLQIIEYSSYINKVQQGVERTVQISATRGLIYDRYGRVLASNEPTYVITVDLQVKQTTEELNNTLLRVLEVLEKNGDTFIDEIPITNNEPFQYTTGSLSQFLYKIPYNNEEHRQELLKLSAEDLITYLRKEFSISDDISAKDARDIIAIRTTMYSYTYQRYKSPTIAINISEESAVYFTENYANFPGINVEFDSIRVYPYGEIMGNIIGYTRTMTDTLYKELKDKGYDENDVVGHEGIEKSMEEILKGQDGEELIEVDTLGRKINTISEISAIKGNDIFLTIDIDLQQDVFTSIETRLSEALIVRLNNSKSGIQPVTVREILISMIECSQLLVSKMEDAPSDSISKEIYTSLTNEYNQLDVIIKEDLTLQNLLLQWVTNENSHLSDNQIILAMHEQGTLHLDDKTIESIKTGNYIDSKNIIVSQLQQGHLKPSQMAIDPFSAAVTVVDVNTGEVLAMVGYPSVDSNMLANNFNSYYSTLFDDRSMLWNRSIMTIKAPGSIFKMVTATAGLVEEVINPTTHITCTGLYPHAGEPEPACWIYPMTGGGHGSIDLQKALEVSCNYYFYEVAHRLELKYPESYGGIDALTEYALMYGLGESTGVELPEKFPNISTPDSVVKQSVNSILSSIKNMSEESLENRVKDVSSMFNKDLFSDNFYNTDDIQMQVLYQIRHDTNRNLEPIIKKSIEEDIDNIVRMAFNSMQGYLQLNIDNVVDDIIEKTMNDKSSRTLESKARDVLKEHLHIMIGESTVNIIEDATRDIDINAVLEIYEKSYLALYDKELKENTNPQLKEFLYNELQDISSNEKKYEAIVQEQIKVGLIDVIAYYLLQNVIMEWNEGITVRTAIGQGYNAFSPIQMARYVAAVANGETVYDLKIVGGIYDNKQDLGYIPTNDKVNSELDIDPSYIEEIHQGMLRVTQGSAGTSRNLFSDFPIDIAGKTGTAQEASHTHSWFAGFAPADNPQIVVVTTVYNEDNLGSFGSQIAKDVFASYFNINTTSTPDTIGVEFLQ